MLKRKIWSKLEAFKATADKKTLLLTGARQVGKTYIVEQFAIARYKSFVEINFVEDSAAKAIFHDVADEKDVLRRITAYAQGKIIPGETLVLFDEVQECPEAVTYAKFLVDKGGCHYIYSGSLLGVELKNVRSVPVGYMDEEEMFPLDFEEFLSANGESEDVIAEAKAAFDLDLLPADYISYASLRGNDSASFANWPDAGHTVAATSTIYKIRSFTGIATLDLPTEAQWEYACRAGTATALNSGKNLQNPGGYDANLAEVGWQLDAIKKIFPGSKMTCPVGMLKPNNWGLYDMHGNLFERCLDRYVTTGDDYRATFATGWADGAVTVDPEGPSTGDTHICRGGSFFYLASHGRSAARTRYANRAVAGQNDGVRFVCTLPVETAE